MMAAVMVAMDQRKRVEPRVEDKVVIA